METGSAERVLEIRERGERLFAIVHERAQWISKDCFTQVPLDALELDSLELLDLFLGIETEFGVKIPDAELAKFETVGDVFDFLNAHAA